MNIWLHWFCLPCKHNIARWCLHEKAFRCDRNRWTYWSIETPGLIQHLVQWFYSGLNVVQGPQQNIPMYRIWDSPNAQALIWIPVSPSGHEYAWPAAGAHLLVFIFSRRNLDLNQCTARHDLRLKERKGLIVSQLVSWSTYYGRSSARERKGGLCSSAGCGRSNHQLTGTGTRGGVNGVLMSELGQ